MNEPMPPFQAHSTTSQSSARAIAPDARSLREQVYALLKREQLFTRGLTDEEIAFRLSMNPSTERPRRIELQRAGLVIDSGERRKTKSGREAVVWVAV
jgi:hypothetical protein